MNDETYHAVVQGVYAEDLGDALTTAAAVNDTVLHVRDVADFDEEGGFLVLNDTVLEYVTCDDDDSTITLAAPLAAAAAVDDRIDVWDEANGQKATVYKAVVDQIDGFDGVATVLVDQSLAHALADTMREATGESVSLARDGSELKLVAVHGRRFALAALQYLQGGMTTRQSEDEAGVDILGADAGVPGIYAFGAGGSPSVLIDATTGHASFLGEIGTALPGDPGIFIYSQTFRSLGDKLVTHPIIQFNTGMTRDQPSIQAENDGTGGSDLFLFSGGGVNSRETKLQVSNGNFRVGTEAAPDDQIYAGSGVYAARDGATFWTDYLFGGNTERAKMSFDGIATFIGYENVGGGQIRGFQYILGQDHARILTSNTMDVTGTGGGTFKGINASAFNVSSDPSSKTNLRRVAGALAALAALTVYDYDTVQGAPDGETRPGRGVLTTDVAEVVPDAVTESDIGQTLDVYALLSTTVAAVQELSAQVESLTARVAQLESAQSTKGVR